MKKFTATIATALCAMIATSASAATLSFVEAADGDQRRLFNSETVTFPDGFSVQVFTSNPDRFSGFLADRFEGANRGLGACEYRDQDNFCFEQLDPRIGETENVSLVFSQVMNLSNFSFNRPGSAGLALNDDGTLLINGESFTFADAAIVSIAAQVITFAFGGENPQAFFLASLDAALPTPLPMAAPLLLSGLAGLFFVSRRRKKEA